MAAGGNGDRLDQIKEVMTCGICIQLYTDPRRLTCGHSYCLICLQQLQKSTSQQKECPVCRETTIPSKNDLENLPSNKLATDLVKLVQTHDPSAIGLFAHLLLQLCIDVFTMLDNYNLNL